MKRKLLLLPVLTFMLLASCNESTPTKHHFNVGCVNCTANFETSLSVDVNENEYVTFKLLPKENYLLPVEIKVTSGNEVLTQNVDYIYTTSEDRLSGEITMKADKAADIYIEADEQGYLYIGNNKISKSGDYTRLDHLRFGSQSATDVIVYDYKTNTLTLNEAVISYETAGLHEFDFVNDYGYVEFDSDKINGLIGWTGGGSFTVRLIGENHFISEGEDDLEAVFVAPLQEDATLNIVGPGSAYFSDAKFSTILNQRGKTFIDNMQIKGSSLTFSGIYSKDLLVSNSHISLTGTADDMYYIGINANYATINRSYIETSTFGIGFEAQILSLVDTDVKMDDIYIGFNTALIKVDGYELNGRYSSNIVINAAKTGITSKNDIILDSCSVEVKVEQGYCIETTDTTIEAHNSYIKVISEFEGVGLNAFQIWLTDCEVIAKAKLALFSSLHGDQEEGREFEPNIEIDNTSIKAIGEIYGSGHFKAINCKDEENYKYFEKEVDEDHEQYLWALCPYSATELEYEVTIDDEGRPYYYPTNALDSVIINAEYGPESQQSEPTMHICDPEKTARYGLGVNVCDKTSYYNSGRSIEIWGLSFYNNFGRAGDQIELEYWAMLYHKYVACPTFTIVIVDKDGNEIGAFRNHHLSSEGMTRAIFTRDYCVRGNELAIHSFIEDFKETGLQNYQVYLESIAID